MAKKIIEFEVDHTPYSSSAIGVEIKTFWSPSDERRFILPIWQFEEIFQNGINQGAIVLHNPVEKKDFKIELIQYKKNSTSRKKAYKESYIYLLPNWDIFQDALKNPPPNSDIVIYIRFYSDNHYDYPIILIQYSDGFEPNSSGNIGPNGSGDGYPLKGGS